MVQALDVNTINIIPKKGKYCDSLQILISKGSYAIYPFFATPVFMFYVFILYKCEHENFQKHNTSMAICEP